MLIIIFVSLARDIVMAISDMFKISRKTFVNPRGWLGYDTLKEQTQTIWTVLKGMFSPAKPEREETFEQALKRLNLTEADVKATITTYRYYALLFLVLAVLSLAYTFFLLFRYGTITGWMLGMAMTGLLTSQAFKYDFWAFQMRRRQLGATFSDWKKAFLGEKGST